MARPVRAAADKAVRQKKLLNNGKAVRRVAKAKGSDELSELATSTSSSSDNDVEEDTYKEPDSDAIDDESNAGDNSDADEEEEEIKLHVVEEDSEGEEVLDFTIKKKIKAAHISGSGKRKVQGAIRERGNQSKRSKHGSDFEDEQDADEQEDEEELKDGRKIVRTKLVKAPTSTVRAGVIDSHTLGFLADLIENNDRDWCVYVVADINAWLICCSLGSPRMVVLSYFRMGGPR